MSAIHPEIELIPYLRGELTGRERERLASHLGGCAECRAQADELARTLAMVAEQIERLPAPDWTAYRAELRRKLADRQAPPRRWWQPNLVWGSMIAAGVAAVTLVTVLAVYRRNPVIEPMVDQLVPVQDEISQTDVGLLRNYAMVERLDLLDNDNYDVIEHLDELTPPQANAIQRS